MLVPRRPVAPACLFVVAFATACGPSAVELARAKVSPTASDATVVANRRVAYEGGQREEVQRKAEEAARIAREGEALRAAEADALAQLQANAERDGMAVLPGGTYSMGDTHETVTVAPFALDRTEVTVAMYSRCVGDGACSAHEARSDSWEHDTRFDRFCNWGEDAKRDHPMNCIDWNQATAYCEWAGKRLPTEAEWEWAARGQSRGTRYPWGDEPPEGRACWSPSVEPLQSARGTCPVGAFPRGDAPGGIHDLQGNVSELTSTAYDRSDRVLRGGSWIDHTPSMLRAGLRGGSDPWLRSSSVGFRCARGPGPTRAWLAVEATRYERWEAEARESAADPDHAARVLPSDTFHGVVSIGPVEAKGDSMTIEPRLLAKLNWGLRACYRNALRSDPILEGSVRLRVTIGGNGEMPKVESEHPLGLSAEVVRCLAASVEGAPFPSPKGRRVVLTIPVSLRGS